MDVFGRNTRRGYESLEESSQQTIIISQEDEISCKIYGYTKSKKRSLCYILLNIFFLGIPFMICFWYPQIKVFKYKKCPLKIAQFVLIKDDFGNHYVIDVLTDNMNFPRTLSVLRYFYFQHDKYVWDPSAGLFLPVKDLNKTKTLEEFVENCDGLCEAERTNLLKLFGPNKIEIKVKSYWTLFIEEVFNPFYIFQAFSIILWCFDDYMLYAGCVLVLTLASAITTLIQTRKQSVAIHNMVESSNSKEVQVLKGNIIAGNTLQTIDACGLVPGDLIVLPSTGYIMPCDAVLLTGHCIVNESMLTGESVPVVKTPPNLSNELYDSSLHKRHTLFSGTHLIQTRYYGDEYVLARVVNTGFNTVKGALVKSILFPAPVGIKFYKDSLKFVLVLFVIAAIGMSYCIYMYIDRKAEVKEIIIRTLDIITIVVPPALPAAMAVGIANSQNRLKKLGIFCISPPKINVCGKIKLVCFDKTGTLTHDGLDLYSVVPCVKSKFVDPLNDVSCLDIKSSLLQSMATCHSLTRIDGKLTGDPLDLVMFECTKWELEEAGDKENTRYDLLAPTVVKPKNCNSTVIGSEDDLPYEIGIIKQFPFSSSQQCMSVITRILGSKSMIAFTKGAPEKIKNMCLEETLPDDFSQRLVEYTSAGFRVIALAYKNITISWKEAQKIKREKVECDLTFLGFLVMQNPLKPATAPVICSLHNANIRNVMITGDNIMTAISVARDCGMVSLNDKIFLIKIANSDSDGIPKICIESVGSYSQPNDVAINFDNTNFHFALDGKTWVKLKIFYSDLLPLILVKGTIFARFQPDHKTQLIKYFQKLDYVVSMVGDGANDCGALKAAHVGVSLSQAEASVAAPFTSTIEDISCMLHLMLEGRCALVTSFAVFKYMALYSLIQFFTIIILYKHYSILGDFQFLFIDLIVTTSLAVTIGRQGPAKKLVPKRPLGSLVSVKNLIPLILQVFICGLIQILSLYYLYRQKWFEPLPSSSEEVVRCWENTVLFGVSSYQYIILAVVYSKGRPYRQTLITNFWFLIATILLTCFITWLLVVPEKHLAEFFEIMYLSPPSETNYEKHIFRYKLLFFPVVHLIIAVFIEVCIADTKWLKYCVNYCVKRGSPKSSYKVLMDGSHLYDWFDFEENSFRLPNDGNL